MTKKSNPASKAKARGGVQPALPGLEPSPAWQKMKSAPKKKPKGQKVHRTNAGPGHPSWRQNIVPGKCTCGDQLFEDNGVRGIGWDKDGNQITLRETPNPEGVKMNPWVFGHAYWCSMFMPKCDWCGQTGGTHHRDCQFWKQHPEITPF